MSVKDVIERIQSNKWGDFLINLSLVIIFTLSLSWLLDYDPYSLFEVSTDYNSGDYYDRLYHDNTTLPIDRDIVIIASDRIPNDSLPDVLRKIGRYGAKAIGFDLIFKNESSLSNDLIDVIDSLPQIVMPVELIYDGDSGLITRGEPSLLDEYLDNPKEATVSFPIRPTMSFQRDMYLKVGLGEKDTIESFPLVLAKMKDPDIKLGRTGDLEAINFNVSDFEIIGYEEFNDPDLSQAIAALINGKIVLVGDVSNKYDVHPTPVDENMPGILVHAASISTLLNNRPIRPLGRIWNLIFIILCVAIVTAADSYYSDKDDFRKGLGFLVIKGVLLAVMLIGGYLLYVHCGIRSDFTYSITLFMFSMMIADLWFGLRNYLEERKEKKVGKETKQ